eukprot:m.146868 g.146868  ORF g.146868 m.146868 type:complete len:581 (+) comp23126_c1_seq6:1356-3098(+)
MLGHVMSRKGVAVVVRQLGTRCLRSTSGSGSQVVGCGSNVVDQFLRLRVIPKVGEKGYFSSPTQIFEASVVGGVTLNHLSWAAMLGVPTAGLFLQGKDASGEMLRAEMVRQGVSIEHVQASSSYATAESYVLLQDDGERSIVMATGSTSEIDGSTATKHFGAAVKAASIFTTEISQVPLSGVAALLTTANDNGVLSVLDIDVQPSVATNEAGLGSTSEIIDCIKQARVLKPAMHAAREVVGILMPEIRTEIASMPADELGKRMRDAADCDLVALTDGGNGCALVTADLAITVPTGCHIDVIDATGAGDAFLGGLIAGIYNEGLPVNEIDLLRLGQLANATGAACCLAIGGLPTTQSAAQLTSLLAESTALDFSDCIVPLGSGGVSAIGMLAGFQASLANDSATLSALADSFDLDAVEKTVTTLLTCRGRVLVTGLGKSGVVAQRLAASLTSTGTAAHFVHAAEWSHGDLGVCRDGDVVVALSHSGKTPECVSAMAHIKARGTSVVAITSDNASPMAKQSDVSLTYTIPADMEPVGGAPTTSVVAQESIVNALVVELILRRGFTAKDFKHNHPGGALGGAV